MPQAALQQEITEKTPYRNPYDDPVDLLFLTSLEDIRSSMSIDMKLIIEHIAALLGMDNLDIDVIAHTLGFRDNLTFCRTAAGSDIRLNRIRIAMFIGCRPSELWSWGDDSIRAMDDRRFDEAKAAFEATNKVCTINTVRQINV